MSISQVEILPGLKQKYLDTLPDAVQKQRGVVIVHENSTIYFALIFTA